MLGRTGARNKTRKRWNVGLFVTTLLLPPSRIYLKAGMGIANFPDDSSGVNVHAWMPTVWVEVGMLLLNLAVWLEAAARLAGLPHAV